jgi:carbon-monoxide dehydrogenase small subunit
VVAAPPGIVWETIGDPSRLAGAVGSTATVTRQAEGRTELLVSLSTGLGHTSATLTIEERSRRPGEQLSIGGEGRLGDSAVRFTAELDLEPAGTGTRLRWDADVAVSGVLGSIAQRVLAPVVDGLLDQMCERIERGDSVADAPATVAEETHEVSITLNGAERRGRVPARRLLIHFLRDELDATGPHIGCDSGNCGACTVVVDGLLTKSCMLLAVQADGSRVETVEGMQQADGGLHPLQEAFSEHHALQCGYCTPGMLMSARFLLERNPEPTEHEIRRALKGNICRCTGYQNIVDAIQAVASQRGDHDGSRDGG